MLFAVVLFASGPSWGGLRVACSVLLAGWCAWVVLIRPKVSVVGPNVVLKNSLIDLSIPSQLIDDVTVRAYLMLTVGNKRYTSTAVGYRPSSVARGHADLARGLVSEAGRTRVENPVAYAEEYLRTEVARAKSMPPSQSARVTRSVAIAPLATLIVLVAVLLGATLGSA